MNGAKAKPNRSARRGSGRPTKEQAEQITELIIDVATRLFSETNFEATSVDLIAATARISKQTFYARFVSKEALFAVVIRKRMNDLLMPVPGETGQAGPIETTLLRIGLELSRRALTPAAIALDRLIALAEQFLYAVVDGPAHALILSGKTAKSEKELRERTAAAVGLFLDGCRDHPARRR